MIVMVYIACVGSLAILRELSLVRSEALPDQPQDYPDEADLASVTPISEARSYADSAREPGVDEVSGEVASNVVPLKAS